MVVPILIGIGLVLLLTAGTPRERPLIAPVPGVDVRGHARRIREGYILSGMIAAENVPRIRAEGIRAVVSLKDPGDPVRVALARSGIEWVRAYLGSTWRHTAVFADVASRYRPDQILIHCEHGADRTGNVGAHYLVTRHGWPVPDAFYAVVNPVEADVSGLNGILRRFGLPNQGGVGDPGMGVYSLRGIGKSGGMKAHGDYVEMIEGNIDSMR